MMKRAGESKQLDRILMIMKLLQSHLEEANFDITEFEEVEIFLDLAIAAGEKQAGPALALVGDELLAR
ncbi:MAG: hypothetical protein ACE37M_07195 [Henriciella sp.]